MPSTWSRLSICAPSWGWMEVTLTASWSSFVSLRKVGNSFSAPSLGAPPSVLPARSAGALMPLSAFTAMAKGGRL